MTTRLDPLIEKLLDGEIVLADLPPERRAAGARALEWLRAVDRAPVELSPALEEHVMARVRRRATSPTWRAWRWLVGPHDLDLRLRVRPWALAVVTVVAAVALVVTRPLARDTAQLAGRPSVYVRLVFFAPGAHQVSLAGTFNHWDPNAALLAPAETPGFWTITVSLPPGQYQYGFLVDGRWVTDPAAPALDDGFGRRNSVLSVAPEGSGSRAS